MLQVTSTKSRAVLSIEDLKERTRSFCLHRPVQKLEVFGSVARGEASAESDVDLLVTFDPAARFGMFTFLEYKSERNREPKRFASRVSSRMGCLPGSAEWAKLQRATYREAEGNL